MHDKDDAYPSPTEDFDQATGSSHAYELRLLVDALISDGEEGVREIWDAIQVGSRPIRDIDTHVRTAEIKTLGLFPAA